MLKNPLDCFAEIKDPRIHRRRLHDLQHIIAIALICVIAGADSWDDLAEMAEVFEDWLTPLLGLKNGIPSHDTFNRVFSLLDPKQMERCFLRWTQDAVHLTQGEVVAIDGKTLRGSGEGGIKPLVHMVSAWAHGNDLVLGQVKVDEKTNEIKAIPELLSLLILKGCIVTIDAMGCQKEIAAMIKAQKAHYVLALKGNQGKLHEQVKESFRTIKPHDQDTTTDAGHGRVETRTCSVLSDLSLIEEAKQWDGLTTLVRIESTRMIKKTGKETKETRYYISSLASDAAKLNQAVRAHWSIENKLHWQLDVTFSEDASLKSAKHAAQNFSLLNRIALNQLKACPVPGKPNFSLRNRRRKCGRSPEYWMEAITKQIGLRQPIV